MTNRIIEHNSVDDSHGSNKFKISMAFSATGRMKITTDFGTIYAYGDCPNKHSKLLSIPDNPDTFLLLPSYEHITSRRPKFVTIEGNLLFTKSDAMKVCRNYSDPHRDECVVDIHGWLKLGIKITEFDATTTKRDHSVDVLVNWDHDETGVERFTRPYTMSSLPWLQFSVVDGETTNQLDKLGKYLLVPTVYGILQDGKQY
jgi:hypothetical protein